MLMYKHILKIGKPVIENEILNNKKLDEELSYINSNEVSSKELLEMDNLNDK